ncbi:LAMI_0H11188g1_1 [Lachancea mirantina]|uniref:LAMI_0H11188g1_1 n=1 Tax=Lachancea mirantina TaxID=1230905 RepID=A0A1G4KH22_9SACH|nr:LAMI_0H11188g1_1 [Lachancea mirantina]
MADSADLGPQKATELSEEIENIDNPSPKKKPTHIQLTFNDFKNIKVANPHSDHFPGSNGSAENLGLRRSRRVVPKRPVIEVEEEIVTKQPSKKRKPLKPAKESNIDKDAARERARKLQQQASLEKIDNLLAKDNWTPCLPLNSSEFKTHHSIVSRLKYPNMKYVPHAGDIITMMTFINKFSSFLPKELWSLSFHDFEVGLDLYPQLEKDEPKKFYQDYMLVKDILKCQDKMNFLFLTLMKLTLNDKSPASFDSIRGSFKPFPALLARIRSQAWSWGYPKEWKVPHMIPVEGFDVFTEDDCDAVDPNLPEILTPNMKAYKFQEPLGNDPLQSLDLEKKGILALQPNDRLILLRSLTQWCLSHSDKIHGEIYRLVHLKRDFAYGVPTFHVPRYLVEGELATRARFSTLGELIQSKLELRRTKKHIRKQLESGKRNDLSHKYKILDEVRAEIRLLMAPREDNDAMSEAAARNFTTENNYDQWCAIFEGEVPDHPLSSPFADEAYRLRSSEFFLGRVPHVGDFYMPRLFSYQGTKSKRIPSYFTDLVTLNTVLTSIANGELDAMSLFTKQGKLMSTKFKVFYHDSPSMIRDVAAQVDTTNKCYWFEMCHDCDTLKEFITLLEYKSGLLETSKDDQTNKTAQNKNPLPKESKFNASRDKLRIMHDYLIKIVPLLKLYEELGLNYGDVEENERTLRRSQRNKQSYEDVGGSSGEDDRNEMYNGIEKEEEEEVEETVEAEDEDDIQGPEYVEEDVVDSEKEYEGNSEEEFDDEEVDLVTKKRPKSTTGRPRGSAATSGARKSRRGR